MAVMRSLMVMATLALCNAAPPVTNSLVNLGKMDIAFYIDTKPQDVRGSPLIKQRLSGVPSEPCACMGLTSARDTNPLPNIMTRLLRNNDIFPFNKPAMSPLCCDSHEQLREESIILEMGPQQRIGSGASLPAAALLDALVSAPGLFPQDPHPRSNPIELLIFPSKKEVKFPEIKKNKLSKDGIKAVGDRELRNDFKTLKPPSVKKDLTGQEVLGKEDKRDDMRSNSNTNLV
ncbi:unnamed protein product [Pieris brassicae]|uniref:Uncharacterized protein n=1 Tax=Pieris brassicae TaxID=7116 RepID=A0A9P0WSL9_PIEBR|nr:unnamed protein product [Pieris brassicae]